MRYELWLAVRYLLARRRERFISLIAALSIGGVARGVMAQLVVLSVMSGFDYDLKEKLVGANAHLTVDAAHGIPEVEPLLRAIAATPHVVGVAPVITGQAILRLSAPGVASRGGPGPDRAFGVLVRGMDLAREAQVSKLADYMVVGRLPGQPTEVVVGSELAAYAGLAPGKTLQVIGPATGKLYALQVSGIFHSGMYEYDAGLIGVTIPTAQELFGLGGAVTAVAVRLDALERAGAVQQALSRQLGPPYAVKTWMQQNQTLFDALQLEKLTMFVILTLIVLVAAINIASTLIMTVIEKTRDIGILKSVGASPRSIRAIFRWQGLVIGGLGTLFGALGAWAIVWLLDTYQFIRLPSTIYYLDHLPVRIERGDWWVTVGCAMLISWLATVYPARQAARLAPVEALRYE